MPKFLQLLSGGLNQGLVDACVVGGADSLCLSVIYGFHSLQLVAEEACRPFDAQRSGISLGEAAGFALLERAPDASGAVNDLQLLAAGESCDAYHMSSAHPDGLGARLSMQRALEAANLTMAGIDYVNLHGTGTRANGRNGRWGVCRGDEHWHARQCNKKLDRSYAWCRRHCGGRFCVWMLCAQVLYPEHGIPKTLKTIFLCCSIASNRASARPLAILLVLAVTTAP